MTDPQTPETLRPDREQPPNDGNYRICDECAHVFSPADLAAESGWGHPCYGTATRNLTGKRVACEAHRRVVTIGFEAALPSCPHCLFIDGIHSQQCPAALPSPSEGICECGTTLVCPDIGCNRHKVKAGAVPPVRVPPK